MVVRGRGRGRGRGRDTSQTTPTYTPSPHTHTPSPQSHTEPTSTSSPHSHTEPTFIPSTYSQRGLAPISSLHVPSPHSHIGPTSIPSPQSQVGIAHLPSSYSPSPHFQTGPTPSSAANLHLVGDPSASSSAPPHIEVELSISQNIRWGRKDVDGRIWIRPANKQKFYPDVETTRDITYIFKKKYEEPWTSWSEVTDTVRDLWFKDFGAKYKWLHEDNDMIRRIFERKGSGTLSNNLFKVRDRKNKGEWIHPNARERLWAKWSDPAWQAMSMRNSQNRQSKEGLNVHNGGSISAIKHSRRMANQMFREPSFFEVYKRLHRAKDNSEKYITSEVARIAEEYERRMAELQSQNGEGSSSQDSANSIYLDVVGGPNKKGRIYGLGSQATNIVGSSSTPSTSFIDEVSPTEIVAMQAKI